jgi:hypothetical protein
LGQYTERKIDWWKPLSYLNLNKADEKEITKIASGNRSTLQKAVGGILSLLILPVFTKVAAGILISYWLKK